MKVHMKTCIYMWQWQCTVLLSRISTLVWDYFYLKNYFSYKQK